jgi:hypothetical protein
MKKMFFVVCVVMLASLVASAQLVAPTVYNRTFYGYCNGEHMVLQKRSSCCGTGSTKVYVAGYEDLTSACGFPYNAPTVGQKHAIGVKVPPREIVAPLNGRYLDIASAAADYISGGLSGFQEEWMMDVQNNVAAGYFSQLGFDGDYIFTEVFLTNGLPSKTGNAVGKPVLGGGKMLKSITKK